MKSGIGLDTIEQVHFQLEWLFHQHQLTVLQREFSQAWSFFDQFDKLLLAHMEEEERLLFPLYKERCGKTRGGAPVLFLGEHKKLREFLVLLHRLFNELKDQERHRKETLDLLEKQYLFKELLNHHFLREQTILFPELNRVTSDLEKREILRNFTLTS